jgi:hypothetical protein
VTRQVHDAGFKDSGLCSVRSGYSGVVRLATDGRGSQQSGASQKGTIQDMVRSSWRKMCLRHCKMRCLSYTSS